MCVRVGQGFPGEWAAENEEEIRTAEAPPAVARCTRSTPQEDSVVDGTTACIFLMSPQRGVQSKTRHEREKDDPLHFYATWYIGFAVSCCPTLLTCRPRTQCVGWETNPRAALNSMTTSRYVCKYGTMNIKPHNTSLYVGTHSKITPMDRH